MHSLLAARPSLPIKGLPCLYAAPCAAPFSRPQRKNLWE